VVPAVAEYIRSTDRNLPAGLRRVRHLAAWARPGAGWLSRTTR